jgi:hypothetical protein
VGPQYRSELVDLGSARGLDAAPLVEDIGDHGDDRDAGAPPYEFQGVCQATAGAPASWVNPTSSSRIATGAVGP